MYCEWLVYLYGLVEFEVDMIKNVLFLYDVGKVVILDSILYKFGKFDV